MKKLLPILILVFCMESLSAKINFIEVENFVTWEQMLALATASNKQLFVYLHDPICGACKQLTKETFKSKKLSESVENNFLALEVYTFSEVGIAMTKRYLREGENTFLVFNSKEVLFLNTAGYRSADELDSALSNLLPKILTYPAWQKGSAMGKLEKEEWFQFLLIEELNQLVTPLSPIVRDVSSLADSADFKTIELQEFTMKLAISVDNPIFQTLKKKQNWVTNSAHFNWPDYIKAVFDYNISIAIATKDSIFLEDILFQLRSLPLDSNLKNISLKGRQLYLAELNKWFQYDTITLNYLTGLPPEDANAYQEEAIYLMEHYSSSRTNKLALNYLQLGLKQKETFELYYTLGLLLYNQNDFVNAYKATYRAWEIAEGTDEKSLAGRLLQAIDNTY